jgi:acyl-coenzyme A synthetase/AMP-(fatty) acid ligase
MDLPTEFIPFPALWDHVADHDPDRPVVSIPVGSEIKDGYRDVTARTMSQAIDRASWFLERELGRSKTFQTVCYVGPSDLRYPMIMAAASKTGYQTFWSSPRNSFEGHVRLMEATKCSIFLTPSTIPPGIEPVIKRLKMQHIIIPDQSVWLDSTEPVQRYPFTKSYDECKDEPYTIIHTSGSTGS